MKLLVIILSILFCTVSHASFIHTQTFDNKWNVDVWDYSGTVSALEWGYQQYQPWNDNLGDLTEVIISLELNGTKIDANDDVNIRVSFFTGWNPNRYQYHEEFTINNQQHSFTHSLQQIFITPSELESVTNYEYYTGSPIGLAWFYFESQTLNDGHSIEATTALTFKYEQNHASKIIPVNAPTGFGLFGLALLCVLFERGRFQA